MLKVKLKNLLRAYKATKDNTSRTGAGASYAPFHDVMEEIFGTRPEIRNTHTLSMMQRTPSVGLDISTNRTGNHFHLIRTHFIHKYFLS